jgi:hypothetical protein
MAAFCDEEKQLSISDPQQLLPLPKVAFEAHAFGNLESRDDASLDLLPAFSRSITSGPVFLPRTVEVSREFVMLPSLQVGEQLLDRLLHFGEFRNEGLALHLSGLKRSGGFFRARLRPVPDSSAK